MFLRKSFANFATKNSRIDFRSNEIEHLKATKGASVLEYKSLTFVMWGDDVKNKVSVKAWKGNAAKPFAFYGWTIKNDDLTSVYKWIDEQKMWADRLDGYKQERKEANKAGHTLEVGNIVYTSWGYDQTNVGFFQVVGIPSASYVELRPIKSKSVSGSDGFMSCRLAPCPNDFCGESFKKMAKGKRVINADRSNDASLYDAGERGVYCSWYA